MKNKEGLTTGIHRELSRRKAIRNKANKPNDRKFFSLGRRYSDWIRFAMEIALVVYLVENNIDPTALLSVFF